MCLGIRHSINLTKERNRGDNQDLWHPESWMIVRFWIGFAMDENQKHNRNLERKWNNFKYGKKSEI